MLALLWEVVVVDGDSGYCDCNLLCHSSFSGWPGWSAASVNDVCILVVFCFGHTCAELRSTVRHVLALVPVGPCSHTHHLQ